MGTMLRMHCAPLIEDRSMRVQRDAGGGGVGDDRDQLITLQRSVLSARARRNSVCVGSRSCSKRNGAGGAARCELLAAAACWAASNSFKKDAFSFKFSFCADHEPSDCRCCCG